MGGPGRIFELKVLSSSLRRPQPSLGLDVYLSNVIVLLYRQHTSRKAFAPDMRPLVVLGPLI